MSVPSINRDRRPWKKPLEPKHVWSIRVHLEIARSRRDLAIVNLAIDSKLRACDLVKLRVDDICSGASVRRRATIVQKKTGRPVQFKITEQSRSSVEAWLPILRATGSPISLPKSTARKSSPIHPSICPAGASLGRKHRLGIGPLWHALDAANEGCSDLPQDGKSARGAAPTWTSRN
jgi:hypothetical protein